MAKFLDSQQKAAQAVLETVPSTDLSEKTWSSFPDLNITVTPKYLEPAQISSLAIQMVIGRPNLQQGQDLAAIHLEFGNVPSCRYDGDALSASDEQGLLNLKIEDEGQQYRRWIATRETVGNVTLSFEAFPREVDKRTQPGPRVELAKDQGGLMGSGISFLPLPTNESETYNINLHWNLERAPAGTSAVWAFGEGDTSRIGPASDLGAFYAVGPVRKYSRPEKDFGMYWFGETPFDSIVLAANVESLLSKMLEFFEESDPTFRVFVRKAVHRSFGGTGSQKSFLLEYDEDFRTFIPIDEQSVTSVLAHEMVHEWPMMGSGNDVSRNIEATPAWYAEGIAVYYQAILPYRFGVFTRSQFLKELNSIASAYYTSPAIEMDDNQAEKVSWENPHAQRIPYFRGAMFLFKLDAEIRAKSGGKRSLYEPMIALLKLKNARKPYGLEQWFALVEAELNRDLTSDVKDMLSGKFIVPSPDCLAHLGLKLVRKDQERHELGFDQISISKGVITGLKPGSRAAAAGLKEGDIFEKSYPVWLTANEFDMRSVVRVVRGEETIDIEYWPRTWEKVESYQWIEEQDGSDMNV